MIEEKYVKETPSLVACNRNFTSKAIEGYTTLIKEHKMEIKTEGSGLCPNRLQNVDAYLKRIVDSGRVAGAGGLIIRHGVWAYRKSFGMQDIADKIPLQNDSIYRIYSMTKTFTVAAAMTLYERGLFKLHDPIGEFLPAFTNMQVARHDSRGCMELIPARSPITFQHLFTMTSGIPYPGGQSYSARFLAGANEKIAGDGKGLTTARIVDAAAQAPLCFHPGEYWMYGFSHDVLGRLIEVLSGKSLSHYMEEVIFKPLGLRDTAFYVPAEKQGRLCKAYDFTEQGLTEITGLDTDAGKPFPPAFESGGGGLASTLDDVGRYALMLLNAGKLDGERVLSRKTIDLIRRNHVAPSQLQHFGFPGMAGYGYGLGVRTMLDTGAAGLNGSTGEWAWDGMLGTWYCVDPAEDLAAVFLIQRRPGGNDDLPKRFAQTVYAAIDD
ncbi:MAG: beta-lactamase family protein [Treponema sp.]|jgi:CubicO group peptidase (beta-lactamase class C family)|nr:beta-lactamase family protein [Treponema sp.]